MLWIFAGGFRPAIIGPFAGVLAAEAHIDLSYERGDHSPKRIVTFAEMTRLAICHRIHEVTKPHLEEDCVLLSYRI